MQMIQRGAEAVLYLEERDGHKVLVKDRLPKGYRIRQLDERIRVQRTRHEESLLMKAKRAGVSTPNVLEAGESRLVMEWIEGSRLKDGLNGMEKARRMLVYRLMGESIGRLHAAGVGHGALTTSKMKFKGDILYIIDFGLGKISGK